MNTQPFAEIIESSLATWRAQSWQWDTFPIFGSLVVITTPERRFYGLVDSITTGPLDQHRVPFPFQKTEEELLRDQPQIFAFLATTFTCIALGYQENDTILYQLPPHPPKIHAFVRTATPEEYAHFFACEQYVYLLFGARQTTLNLDEVLLALLTNMSAQGVLTDTNFTAFMEAFSLLTGNDYRRTKLFLQRASRALKQ